MPLETAASDGLGARQRDRRSIGTCGPWVPRLSNLDRHQDRSADRSGAPPICLASCWNYGDKCGGVPCPGRLYPTRIYWLPTDSAAFHLSPSVRLSILAGVVGQSTNPILPQRR